MNTKTELRDYLKTFESGTSPTVTRDDMVEIFGIELSRNVVETWLKSVGLAGFKIENAGNGPTAGWVFQRI